MLLSYREFLPREVKTCRLICSKFARETRTNFLLSAEVKLSELNPFLDASGYKRIGFFRTDYARCRFDSGECLVEEKHTFTVICVTPDTDCTRGYRCDRMLNANCSNCYDKILNETPAMRVVRGEFEAHNSEVYKDGFIGLSGQTSCHSVFDVDLTTKRKILLKRCERFTIDPKFVTDRLIQDAEPALTTMTDRSLACYTIINALVSRIPLRELRPLIVDGDGHLMQSPGNHITIPNRERIVKVLSDVLKSLI